MILDIAHLFCKLTWPICSFFKTSKFFFLKFVSGFIYFGEGEFEKDRDGGMCFFAGELRGR